MSCCYPLDQPHGSFNFRLQLHGAIYRPDSFVLMLRYCANLKAIIYESTSLNRIVGDKSHRVIVALDSLPSCKCLLGCILRMYYTEIDSEHRVKCYQA